MKLWKPFRFFDQEFGTDESNMLNEDFFVAVEEVLGNLFSF